MGTIRFTPTYPAMPSPVLGITIGIRLIVNVALRTMSFVQLACSGDRSCSAPASILSERYRLKMIRPHAITNSTEMVNGQSIRDQSLVQLIRETVSKHQSRFAALQFLMKGAVSQLLRTAVPQPTSCRLFYFHPETFRGRKKALVVGRCIHVRMTDYSTADM